MILAHFCCSINGFCFCSHSVGCCYCFCVRYIAKMSPYTIVSIGNSQSSSNPVDFFIGMIIVAICGNMWQLQVERDRICLCLNHMIIWIETIVWKRSHRRLKQVNNWHLYAEQNMPPFSRSSDRNVLGNFNCAVFFFVRGTSEGRFSFSATL